MQSRSRLCFSKDGWTLILADADYASAPMQRGTASAQALRPEQVKHDDTEDHYQDFQSWEPFSAARYT